MLEHCTTMNCYCCFSHNITRLLQICEQKVQPVSTSDEKKAPAYMERLQKEHRNSEQHKGKPVPSKTDEFSEKFGRGGGGGVISNPKIYVADFCHYKGVLRS